MRILAILAAANLLWPTSAPLLANGIPLNRSVEYILATLFLAWLAFVALRAALKRVAPFPERPEPFRRAARMLSFVAIVFGVVLLFVRVSYPITDSFEARYSTPELPAVDHLFLADNWYLTSGGRDPAVSRYEEQLSFDPRLGQTWRLSAFNSLSFNLYNSAPGSVRQRREELRKRDAQPFDASFDWNSKVGDRLASLYPAGAELLVRYRGDVSVTTTRGTTHLPFSSEEREEKIDVSAVDLKTLRLSYANFSCPDSRCRANLTMNPIPIVDSVFQVRLAPTGGPTSDAKPLTTALLAEAEPLLSLSRLGPAIEMAFLLALLARAAIWTFGLLLASWPGRRDAAIAGLLAVVLWAVSIELNGHISLQVRHMAFVFIVVPAAFAALLALRVIAGRTDQGNRPAINQGMLLVVTLGLMVGLPSLMAVMSTQSQLETADVEAVVWKTAMVFPEVMLGTGQTTGGGTASVQVSRFGLGWNESWISPVGDDPLTYSSWARDFLASPKPLLDPTMIASKPFFIYYRAALYAIFGDGDTYTAILARQLTWWCAAAVGLFLLAAVSRLRVKAPPPRFEAGSILLALLGFGSAVWLAHSMVTYAAPTAAWQFSEGPAWQLLLLSMAFLLGAMAASDPRLCLAAGIAFAVGVMMRTTNLPLAAVGLVMIWMAFPWGSRLVRAGVAFTAPILAALLAVWLQAGAPLSMPKEVAEYYAANTGIPRDRGLAGLVPDAATLAVAAAALISVMVAIYLVKGALGRAKIVGLTTAILAGGYLPVISQLAAPYYPRSVIPVYYVLSLAPAILLLFLWRQHSVSLLEAHPSARLPEPLATDASAIRTRV